jgi:hypothetical protein
VKDVSATSLGAVVTADSQVIPEQRLCGGLALCVLRLRVLLMAWKQTPAGVRVTFWVALTVGVALIFLFILMLWELGHFRPI